MELHYLAFDEIGITMAVLGIAMAFVVLTWNAVKAIHDWRTITRRPTVERIEDHERRFGEYYAKHGAKWGEASEQERMIISNGVRSRSVMEGMPMETITIDAWLDHVQANFAEGR